MRIKSLVAVFITGLTLAVTGCGGVEEQPAPVAAPAPAGEQASTPVQELTACPSKWTCDSSTYYSTQAQCKTACGTTTCYREVVCTAGCLCP